MRIPRCGKGAALPLYSAERLAFPKLVKIIFEAMPRFAGTACREIVWVFR